MNNNSTHIEKALDIIQGFLSYNFEIYSPFVKNVLYQIGIDKNSLPIIKLFFQDTNNPLNDVDNTKITYWKYNKSTKSIAKTPNKKNDDNNIEIFTRKENADLLETLIGWAVELSSNTIGNENKIDENDLSFIFEENQKMRVRTFISYLKNKGDDQYRNFCDNLQLDFYYHFNKSLLNAEYLFLPNYSDLLSQTIDKYDSISDFYMGIGGSVNLPVFIKHFLGIATKTKEMCWRIKQAIGEKNRKIDIYFNVEEYSDRVFQYQKFYDADEYKSSVLHLFTQSVIEMTSIDHIHHANSNNINSLLYLWERIKHLEQQNLVHQNLNHLIKLTKAKTATILYKMIIDIGDEESRNYLNINFDYFFNFGPNNSEELKKEISHERINDNLNNTINLKTKQKNKTITIEQLDKANTKINLPNSDNNRDIVAYNSWIQKGQSHYVDLSSTIESIQSGSKSVSEVIDSVEHFIKIKNIDSRKGDDNIDSFSPFFFLSAICFVRKRLEDNAVNDDQKYKLLKLMSKLLKCLEYYIQTFDQRMPPLFRPYFEHCFYQYDESTNDFKCLTLNSNKITKYNFSDFENSFFFASYYCNPISIKQLNKFYNQSFLQFQSFSAELTQEKEKMIENATKEIKDSQSDFIKKADEKLDSTRHSSIQVLGLFTAFLSFIVTSIGTYKVVCNLWEYIIYSLTYTLAIVLFAFLISDHTAKHYSEQDVPNKSKRLFLNWGKYMAYILTFVFVLVFSIKYYIKNKSINTHEENINGVSITIDNSSTPKSVINLQDLNQNDTIVKDSLIEPVNVESSNDNNPTYINNANQD